ncbi:MAG: DNA polymerase III subunit delta' [Elusimicrobiota bacterium]|jgi:DNA polymerase-3 subunit delta'|nr:DNA polymerase III subunit delta' [Elusimicrobiota bacterium]
MFENILGQDKIKQMLSSRVKNKKIAHAYLFMGQDRVGRKSTAFEFAKVLNCSVNDWTKTDIGACGKCSNCVKISKNIHPDIHLIDFAKQLEVNEDARENTKEILIGTIKNYLQKEISVKAREGLWKFFIIDEAEKMNEQAANALLKTLEEPPNNTIIILIARHKETIPQTIVSRSQVLFFQPLKRSQVISYLTTRQGWTLQKAEDAAQICEGSIPDEASLLDEEDERAALRILTKITDKSLCAYDILELSKSVKKDCALPYIDIMIAKIKNDFRVRPAVSFFILEALIKARSELLRNINMNIVFDNLFFSINEKSFS